MMLQGCLNGGRGKAFHPGVPCSADELAEDAARSVAAGATELHVHPRDAAGLESLEPDDVAMALDAIRARVPGIPVGLSTHWGIPPGGLSRQAPIRAWTVLPDYVSINLAEDDAPEIIVLMLERGVGVEAGIWSIADAERFVTLADAPQCLRILVEITEQGTAEGLAVVNGILDVLGRAGIGLPILLHGEEASVWPMYREALARGFDSRIGFEDSEKLPSGTVAVDNAELLRAAVQLQTGV